MEANLAALADARSPDLTTRQNCQNRGRSEISLVILSSLGSSLTLVHASTRDDSSHVLEGVTYPTVGVCGCRFFSCANCCRP
jgi:hypothetical protein